MIQLLHSAVCLLLLLLLFRGALSYLLSVSVFRLLAVYQLSIRQLLKEETTLALEHPQDLVIHLSFRALS
jgi:hypothetical protein